VVVVGRSARVVYRIDGAKGRESSFSTNASPRQRAVFCHVEVGELAQHCVGPLGVRGFTLHPA